MHACPPHCGRCHAGNSTGHAWPTSVEPAPAGGRVGGTARVFSPRTPDPHRRLGRRPRMWSASDEAVMAGMAAGDTDAAREFIRRYQRRVFGVAATILGPGP